METLCTIVIFGLATVFAMMKWISSWTETVSSQIFTGTCKGVAYATHLELRRL